MAKKNKFNFHTILVFIKRGLIFFFSSTLLVVLAYIFFNPPLTPLMLVRNAGQLLSGEKVELQKKWIPIDSISPFLIQAVIASEDNNFQKHWGFDFEAIQKASKLNEKGGKMRGASTISQQTAKNVFLWPDRTWVRKGFEVYFTGMIELCWSKKRIMEVYLNVIEMGDGIYGAEMAAKTFFNKSAKNLNRNEAALIAAVLPNPRKWHPDMPTPYIKNKQQKILQAMNKVGKVIL
ncbi:MAG: monofunctional biosynthetic peptidoglycan transglycosylase [Bacteroidales bacterium]